MAQRPKPEVRQAIVDAAAEVFAEEGYAGATIAAIATRAGVSTGNVYRYYAGKEELFADAVPRSFVDELEQLIEARMRALGEARSVKDLPPDARYHLVSRELFDFAMDNRARVVVTLARAEGTPHEGFAARLAAHMRSIAIDYARRVYPNVTVTAALRFTLGRVYEDFLGAIAAALAQSDDPARMRAIVAQLTEYHLAGLRALFESLARPTEQGGSR